MMSWRDSVAIRHNAEAKLLVDVGGKDRALERTGNNRRRKEEALIQRRQQAQIRADLLSKARARKGDRRSAQRRSSVPQM